MTHFRDLPPVDIFQFIENIPQDQLKGFDSENKLDPATDPIKVTSRLSRATRPSNALVLARKYLNQVPGAISGQGGHAHTFGVACTLVHGFLLYDEEAINLMLEWNVKCQESWTWDDIVKKVRDAFEKPSVEQPGWMFANNNKYILPENMNEGLDEILLMEELPLEKRRPGSIDDPASLAIKFRHQNMTEHGVCRYVYWQSKFYVWNDSYYECLEGDSINKISERLILYNN